MDTLWLMCGVAVVAVGLLMLFGGSKGRSLDDVYARRARVRAEAAPSTPPAGGRHRPPTAPASSPPPAAALAPRTAPAT